MKTDQGDNEMYAVFLPLARWDCASNSHSGLDMFAFVLSSCFIVLIETSNLPIPYWRNLKQMYTKKGITWESVVRYCMALSKRKVVKNNNYLLSTEIGRQLLAHLLSEQRKNFKFHCNSTYYVLHTLSTILSQNLARKASGVS